MIVFIGVTRRDHYAAYLHGERHVSGKHLLLMLVIVNTGTIFNRLAAGCSNEAAVNEWGPRETTGHAMDFIEGAHVEERSANGN